uniref:G_PROTEIN_RECEP_F1_2 domain-containing protein n=1 Tax=Rhodnius prolixus TaxID=13249 RepID=T1HDB9_RHOPR
MFNNDWNSSYLLGLDRRQHNGQTYYFTFYSEFGERLAETYIEVGLLVTTLAASVIFNLALVLPLWGSKPRTVTNCFLLNLGLADILFAVGIPAVVTVRINPRWPTFAGELMCKLLPYSQLVCGFTILWSLTLISVERYRCLSLDPNFKISSPQSAHLANIIMWSSAMVLFSPFLFWFRHENDLEICTLLFPKPGINVALMFTILITFFTCILPMTILVFNYQRIFIKMVETRQKWATPCVLTSSLSRSHHFLGALSVALLNTAVNPFLTARLRINSCLRKSMKDKTIFGGSGLFKIGSSIN